MKILNQMKLVLGVAATLLLLCTSSCKDEKDESYAPYDPNQPITLTDFYPESGGVATKLILNGHNFGTDAEKVKVFINDKEAAVIETIGDKIYAICPRKPGDGDENNIVKCTVAVQIGDKRVEYPTPFSYQIQTVVTTVCGILGAPDDVVTGNLAQTSMPLVTYLAVDNDNNIFASLRNRNNYYHENKVILVNEDEDLSRLLIPDTGAPLNQPCMLDDGKTVYIPTDNGLEYWTMSSENMWSPIKQQMKPNTGETITIDFKHSFAMCYDDGHMYIRAKNGILFKVHPETGLTTQVTNGLMSGSDSYMAFSRNNPNLLYLAYTNNHCVYTYNLRTGEHKLLAGISGQPGYIDGVGPAAMFNEPRQLILDENDDMYIADTNNHIIRKVTPDGKVSTVIGQPGKSGYQDGSPEDALFNRPFGVCINRDGIIYIADYENQCIRRLAIE
ncbi:MAG: IPT/TIG domain-containing protein [Muribaculaceae bacterium]|nr:IPT/TIG domain-containing protein [Muribaculaceae bacterium]